MANSLIPYSFVPGTKAMASEVNANFLALAQAVDDGKTFTSESIEQFDKKLEERLDESLSGKLERDLANCQNISHCILEMPSRIKCVISNNALVLKAGSVVIVPYGTSDLRSQYPVGSDFLSANYKVVATTYQGGKFCLWVKLQNDISTTNTYTSVAQTFAVLNLTSNNILARGVNDTTFTFTSSTNKVTAQSFADKVFSLPFAIATIGTTGYTSLDQIFNGMGYVGTTVWVDKDIRVLMPNGLNPDGTYKNVEWVTPALVTYSFTQDWTRPMQPIMLYNNYLSANMTNNNYYEAHSDPAPKANYVSWLNLSDNTMYHSENSPGKYTPFVGCLMGYVCFLQGKITALYPRKALKFRDASQNPLLYVNFSSGVGTANRLSPAVVTDTYKSGSNWYRVWSDGWIEQGGRGGGDYSKTYLKPFSDTNYTLLLTSFSTDGSNDNCIAKSITKTGFTAFVETNNSGFWYACGY